MENLTIHEINKQIEIANYKISSATLEFKKLTGLEISSIEKRKVDFYADNSEYSDYEIRVINPFK